jgi:phospholipid transport system substrate-binding protein
MKSMRPFFIALARSLLGILAGLAAFCAQGDEIPPDILVKNVTLEVVALIAGDAELKTGNRAKLTQMIEAKVLPHFDFAAMTALATGPAWTKASAEQKALLIEEFKRLLLRTYTSALTAYAGQRFEFRPLRAKADDTDVTVDVRILQPGSQPVSIEYSMEKSAQGWKAYNMKVGGVSLVANYRTEFSNKIRDAGIDGLIHELHAKNHSLDGPQAMMDRHR